MKVGDLVKWRTAGEPTDLGLVVKKEIEEDFEDGPTFYTIYWFNDGFTTYTDERVGNFFTQGTMEVANEAG